MKKERPQTGRKFTSYCAAFILWVAGLGVLLAAFRFHPEDSLLFSTEPVVEYHHFLGPVFSKTAAFFFYFIGRSVFLLAVVLVYDGYILLRKIKKAAKSAYMLLSGACVVLCMVLFSIGNPSILYKGGGLFGRYIVQKVLGGSPSILVQMLLYIGLTAGLFILFHVPLAGIYRLFTKNKREQRQKQKSQSPDQIPVLHEDETKTQETTRSFESKTARLFSFRGRNSRALVKPPLIQKVIYSGEGQVGVQRIEREYGQESVSPVQMKKRRKERNEAILHENRRRQQEPEPIEKTVDSLKGEGTHPQVSCRTLLKKSSSINRRELERETARKAKELERTLEEFGIEGRVTGITRGPVITRYELQPAPGVKLSRIVNLSNNIALSLSANGVRIEAPIPGRAAVGIEIPNNEREIVTLGDIIGEAPMQGELPLILGKNLSGTVVVSDLTTMPHLLIAGATGSGKSVCVNSLIMSLLFNKTPEEVRFIMMDPKMVELKIYNGIPHLLTEVVTDPRDAAKALRWVLYEMENRYAKLDQSYVRNIKGYNQKSSEKLPYIVVIVDEFANLMAISQKEVEEAVVRLAAMSRAVGIHLIMATQRPSVDVITGLIKANFPYRIAFQVASKTDSRTILDAIGAEKLLGKGDMLFAPAGSMNIQRIQGAYISEEEVLRIVKKMKETAQPQYNEEILSFENTESPGLDYEDPIFDQAVEIVMKTKRASASFLQRRLKVGYNRAARMIELMEEKGIIGPPRGSKPREIYMDD